MPIQRRGLTRRVVTAPAPDTTILYWWLSPSSRADSGVDIKYLIKLHRDQVLSCDCPGWAYSKTEPKACRHTAGAERSKGAILELIRRGAETLPVIRSSTGKLLAAPGNYVDEPDEVIEAAVAMSTRPVPPPKKKRRVVTPSGSVLVEDSTDEVKPTYDRKIEL